MFYTGGRNIDLEVIVYQAGSVCFYARHGAPTLDEAGELT